MVRSAAALGKHKLGLPEQVGCWRGGGEVLLSDLVPYENGIFDLWG